MLRLPDEIRFFQFPTKTLYQIIEYGFLKFRGSGEIKEHAVSGLGVIVPLFGHVSCYGEGRHVTGVFCKVLDFTVLVEKEFEPLVHQRAATFFWKKSLRLIFDFFNTIIF
jgi:hypothetical protein